MPNAVSTKKYEVISVNEPAYKKSLDAIAARLALCRGTIKSNCIGTSLFATFMQDEDRHVTTHKDGVNTKSDAMTFLRALKEINAPIAGCLISWQPHLMPYKISHMGVVVGSSPLNISLRSRMDGELVENIPFEVLNAGFQRDYPHEILYHLPRTLEKSIQTSELVRA